MSSILNDIAAYKRDWVARCKRHTSEGELMQAACAYQPRGFTAALQNSISQQRNAAIAEVKKASPSKGIIRQNFEPVAIAKAYEQADACCLSVLTDVQYFQGSDDYIKNIREHVAIPLLRKDFMLDPYQIIEARAMGADAILIIMAMLDDAMAQELASAAEELGLSILFEVHNGEELERAFKLNTPLMGINNRNLHNFETSLETTLTLLPKISGDHTVITESGIHSHADVQRMNVAGVFGFLVGESLMRQADPGLALHSLLHG